MTQAIMLQGMASDVGGDMLATELCRIFHQDGLHTVPFKSQSMALNSGITPEGKEMDRAQIFQAEAAGVTPDVRMSPMLLKPASGRKAQVVLMSEVAAGMDAVSYHEYKPRLREQILSVYNSLTQGFDMLMLEGAGSPAEIDLHDRDTVNMGMAEMAQYPVVLVVDIDRDGVLVSIYDTLALLHDHERARVKRVIISRLRDDVTLLHSDIEQIEALTGVPVLSVMPWLDIGLEDEDGVALQKGKYLHTDKRDIDIAVIQIPHMSNFTDFNALAAQPDVHVHHVRQPEELAGADLVILSDSKNTLGDLMWLRESGMAHGVIQLHRSDVPMVGIYGDYQILDDTIIDEVESRPDALPGLGLFDTVTHFTQHKTATLVGGKASSSLPNWLADTAGLSVRGYEIHMGEAALTDECRSVMTLHEDGDSVADGAVTPDDLAFGTCLYGPFGSSNFIRVLINSPRKRRRLAPLDFTFHYAQYESQQFDLLADAMRQHISVEKIYTIMQQHREPV